MTLALDLAQTVVIGRFNPHIITPAWLLNPKHAICSEQEAEEQPEPDSYDDGAEFVLAGFEWEAGFDRLAVSAFQPKKDCGEKAAAILKQLPHTPVEAVGNNFVFFCELAKWGDRPKPGLIGAAVQPAAAESRWVGTFDEGGKRLELELISTPEVIILRLNFECRVDDTAQAQKAASEFAADYERARKRVQELFRIDLP
jgi:hypothetical protein